MSSILRTRAPLYRGVLGTRPYLARTFARKFTTPSDSTPPPPPPKSGNGLYIGLGIGAVALLGGVFYVSSTSDDAGTAAKSAIQGAKVAANFAPTKEDYQKVRHLFQAFDLLLINLAGI